MALSSGRRDTQALAAKRPDRTPPKPASFGALRSSSDLVDVRPHLLGQRTGSTISARHLQATGHAPQGPGRPGVQSKGHQRRQSVARLLPDISKLRLLSWLVEASSKLIDCDIAIMDGVYAKLNRSQESLLFWTGSRPALVGPPAPPRSQPVANPLVISQHLKQLQVGRSPALGRNHHSLPITNYDASSLAASLPQPEAGRPAKSLLARQAQLSAGRSASLPSGNPDQAEPARSSPSQNCSDCEDDIHAGAEENDDANSSASSGSDSSSGIHGEESSLSSSASTGSSVGEPSSLSGNRYSSAGRAQPQQQHQEPGKSSAEQLSEKIRRCVLEHNHLQSLLVNIIRQHDKQRDQQRQRDQKISALGNSHLAAGGQSLRVDLADIAESLDHGCSCSCHIQRRASSLDVDTSLPLETKLGPEEKSSTLPRPRSVDNSSNKAKLASLVRQQLKQQQKYLRNSTNKPGEGRQSEGLRSISTSNRKEMINLLADKLCENCFETHYWLHGCFESQDESHKLLKASGGLLSSTATQLASAYGSTSTLADQTGNNTDSNVNQTGVNAKSALSYYELNAIIAKRNATFIKLVQQEVRSTISKAIDLIDLIRREIKSPEYIKQKQLMKCFSSSIQLLTSVSNYVVPSQDISSFIPDDMIDQQQASLFKLPSYDFDHLLSGYQDNNSGQIHNIQSRQQSAAYHLAPAPDIPIRRRVNHLRSAVGSSLAQAASCNDSIVSSMSSTPSLVSTNTTTTTQSDSGSNLVEQKPLNLEQSISSRDRRRQRLGSNEPSTTDAKALPDTTSRTQNSRLSCSSTPAAIAEIQANAIESSSSGASSNNSSASSSIARGAVQQSSLTRSNGSPGIVGQNSSLNNALIAPISNSKANLLSNSSGGAGSDKAPNSRRHDLASLDAIVSLSNVRRQTEEDPLFQSRPKFWQSSKFNFIKKLLHVKQQRLLRQQSKDRRIYNNKVQSKFRLVMMDLTHFNKSQQLLTTENGVNSLLTSMRNVLEFGLYLTLKLY